MQVRAIVYTFTVEFLQPKRLLEWAAPEAILSGFRSDFIRKYLHLRNVLGCYCLGEY